MYIELDVFDKLCVSIETKSQCQPFPQSLTTMNDFVNVSIWCIFFGTKTHIMPKINIEHHAHHASSIHKLL